MSQNASERAHNPSKGVFKLVKLIKNFLRFQAISAGAIAVRVKTEDATDSPCARFFTRHMKSPTMFSVREQSTSVKRARVRRDNRLANCRAPGLPLYPGFAASPPAKGQREGKIRRGKSAQTIKVCLQKPLPGETNTRTVGIKRSLPGRWKSCLSCQRRCQLSDGNSVITVRAGGAIVITLGTSMGGENNGSNNTRDEEKSHQEISRSAGISRKNSRTRPDSQRLRTVAEEPPATESFTVTPITRKAPHSYESYVIRATSLPFDLALPYRHSDTSKRTGLWKSGA
ncbi:hypothetical protein Bbelb_170050 [Branchiostoma belcheri]|nr:hypothetical protein Bbelb_170050 [Branchiostoma belcheri]